MAVAAAVVASAAVFMGRHQWQIIAIPPVVVFTKEAAVMAKIDVAAPAGIVPIARVTIAIVLVQQK